MMMTLLTFHKTARQLKEAVMDRITERTEWLHLDDLKMTARRPVLLKRATNRFVTRLNILLGSGTTSATPRFLGMMTVLSV